MFIPRQRQRFHNPHRWYNPLLWSCNSPLRRSRGKHLSTPLAKRTSEREPIALNRLPNVLLVCAVLVLCIIAAIKFSGWALLGVLWFVAIAGIRVLRIKALHYHLTSQRLRVTRGLLNRKIVEIELFRIRDLTIEQGIIQRLLTLGTVKAISTDEDAKVVLLSGIKDAMKVKEDLRTFVMQARKATGTRDMDMSVVR